MSDSVPVAEAMEQAQAVLDAEPLPAWDDSEPPVLGAIPTTIEVNVASPSEGAAPDITVTVVNTETGEETPAPPATEAQIAQAAAADAPPAPPTQRELFPPPPFDFEEAFAAIATARQRVSVARTVMEDAKDRAASAKKRYDSAVRDLTVEIEGFEDRQRRYEKEVAAVEAANAKREAEAIAAATAANTTTEGGENLSDLEQTIDEPLEEKPSEQPESDATQETSTDAPSD